MTTQKALIAEWPTGVAESYLINAAGLVSDEPLKPLLICAILASPFVLCALPLTWLLMR